MPSGKWKVSKAPGVEGRTHNARAALIDVARDHQTVTTGRGQRADFGRIVGLAVFIVPR